MPISIFAPNPRTMTLTLLLLSFLSSLFFHGTDSVLFGPAILLPLAAGLLLLRPTIFGNWAIPRTATVILIALFWMYLFAALSWSTMPFISLFFFLIISLLPFLFFSLILAPDAANACRTHAYAVICMLGVLGAWTLIQFMFFYKSFGPRIHHPLLDPNNLAEIMNMGLLPAMALFIAADTSHKRRISLALTILLTIGLFLTQSRGGLISAGASLFILLGVMGTPVRARLGRIGAVLTVILGVPLILQAYGLLVNSRGISKSVMSGALASVTDRSALWLSTWEMIRKAPWTGTGLGTFYYHYSAFRLPVDRSDGYFAHMDPLQLWAETGAAAPILFYLILAAALFRTIVAISRTPAANPALRAEIIGPFCGLLALAAHAHITFSLYLPAILIPAACLLAWWYTATESALADTRLNPSVERQMRLTVAAAGLLVCLLVAVWTIRACAGAHLTNVASLAMEANDIDGMKKATRLASLIAPDTYFWVDEYEARWRGVQMTKEKQGSETRVRLFNEAMAYLDRAERYGKPMANLKSDRAKLYVLASADIVKDGQKRAIDELRTLLEADPLSLDSRMGLSMLFQRSGEMEKALAVMEDGLKWPRPKGLPDVNFLIAAARLRLQRGDRNGHDALIQEALARAQYYGMSIDKDALQ